MADFAERLALTIRARRTDLHLTQADLADLSGVSLRAVSNLEGGKPTTRLDIVVPVLDALGLEITIAPRTTP